MGLLNKSNKTKVTLTLGDICTDIMIGITEIRRSSKRHPKLSEDELNRRVKDVGAIILWKKWDTNNAPILGLKHKDKIQIMGSVSGCDYVITIQVIYADGSITEYGVRLIFDRELISGMPLRYYQCGYMIDEKWVPKHVMDSFLKMP